MDAEYWPQSTFEAAEAAFGRVVYNRDGRTYKALDRRIRHALRVWDEKYGPLTPEQERYADDVLASCIRRAARDAAGETRKLWPFAQAGIGRAISHDRVHEGFRRRSGVKLVDVRSVLEGVSS